MRLQVFDYAVYPSVLRADEVSTVTIHPLGEHVAFLPGETYTVAIRGVETACADYDALPTTEYHCIPNEAGDLTFTHRFEGEQRHSLTLTRPACDQNSPYYAINNHRPKNKQNTVSLMAVYSVYEDLYGLRGYKGEVHCHTFDSDGVQDTCQTVGNYRSAGYDFLAITDHFLSFASEKSKRMFDHAPVDMTLLLGEEVHVPTERIHVVHLGGRESVNEYFRRHPKEAKAEVAAIESTLTLPDTVNRNDYAWRVWIAQKAREFGGISILSHPHWIWETVYFMASATTQQLLRDGVHDAYDLLDDDNDVEISAALWNELRAEGVRIPVVGSTDSHHTDAGNPTLPCQGAYTLVFAPDRSGESLMAAIRQEHSLCINRRSGVEFIHGPYRLVKYARFLLDAFFPVYMRLCQGQGVLLSEYPVTGAPAPETEELLAALNARSEAFARRFYGF